MKVEVIDEYKTIVYLHDVDVIDYFDLKRLEASFKSIFLKLKDIYDINVSGYFDIDVHIDRTYGMVLVIEREKHEYFNYYDKQVNMQLNIIDDKVFLYEIDDPFLNLEGIRNIYLYKCKYYVEIDEEIDKIRLGQLLEFGRLVYNEDTDNIKKLGRLLNLTI